jgi:ferredoxin-NADP reductase/ferredoxin
MALPSDLPSEKRSELQQQAHERMKAGTGLLSEGLEALSKSAASDDFAAMEEATARMRQGLAQFESGLAAHRALAEGRAPRSVALEWFKQEMNLLPPNPDEPRHVLFGLPRFHLFVLAILLTFTIAVMWMYVQKMRRAATLLEHLSAVPAAPRTPSQASGTASAPEAPAAVTLPRTETAQGSAVGTAATSPVSGMLPLPPRAPTSPAAVSPRTAPAAVVSPVTAPILPPKRSGPLRVARIFTETPEVKTFRFVNVDGGPIPFTYLPGQFLVLTVAPDGKRVKRSYTIASSPTQHYYCEITVKREEFGLVSGYLHGQLQEGDTVEISAPNGHFTFTGHEADSIVLIGGGVGITPLMSVIRYLTDSGWSKDIFLLFSCRTSRDFIFREELEFLQRRHANLHVIATMTRAEGTVWMGVKGRLSKDLLAQSVPNIASYRIHVCGPPPMMDAVMQMLRELGVPLDHVKTEAFGPVQRPAAKRALATGCTCERCERRRREMAVAAVAATPAPAIEAPRPPVPVVTAPTTAGPAVTTATVTFQTSGKSAPLPPDENILDVADEIGVEIDNSCRVGICGTCKVKLLSGAVTMEVEDGLEPEDKAQGIILACQAKSTRDVAVEA